MSRARTRRAKSAKPTRDAILKGIGWKPLDLPAGLPAGVAEAENRRMQDEIVHWVQGLAAHIDRYDRAQETAAQSHHSQKHPSVSVQVEIDPASEVGAMIIELRRAIDPADLAGKAVETTAVIVRDRIAGSDLDGLRGYLRSLDPFAIAFGNVSSFPVSLNTGPAAVLNVDVFSGVLEEIHIAMEQHANCKPATSDYRPHAVVAYLKPKRARKYAGNKRLAGRTMEVSALSIKRKNGESEVVQLIGAPAPWKEDYIWPGNAVEPPKRKRPKSAASRTIVRKRPPGGR
jgi:hypothetical protein